MKDTILISYDIKNSDEYDYEQLYEYFKSFGTWASITESLWAIKSDKSVTEIRDEVKLITPNETALFVTKSSGSAAWSFVNCSNKWLKDHY